MPANKGAADGQKHALGLWEASTENRQWRGGQIVLGWVAAGILEAVKGFRRLQGHTAMPQLVAALRARHQQLGIAESWKTSRSRQPSRRRISTASGTSPSLVESVFVERNAL